MHFLHKKPSNLVISSLLFYQKNNENEETFDKNNDTGLIEKENAFKVK